MKNVNRNKTGVKSTELKYLYEIAAIPQKTRAGYLQMLLKRKGAEGQKNVRLLKIIYEHILEEKMLQWDSTVICNELDISWEMLWCHKSRLFKGLREFYFGWKEIEKKEFEGKNQTSIEVNFSKAKKMLEIGMKKEAKNIFLEILQNLEKNNKTNNDLIISFNCLKHLCSYYYSRRVRFGFRKYFKKLEDLSKTLNKRFKKDEKLQSSIMDNLYYCRACNEMSYGNKQTSIPFTIKHLKSAFEYAKNSRDKYQTALRLFSLSSLYANNNYHDSKKYSLKGLKIARQINDDIIHTTFKLHLTLLEIKFNKNTYAIDRNQVMDQFKQIKNTPVISFWAQRSLFTLIEISSFLSEQELMDAILYEYNLREIIHNGYGRSLRTLYYMKFDHYLRKISVPELQVNTENKYVSIVIKNSDPLYIRKLDNAILELSISSKLNETIFRKEFLTFMLHADFWKGNKCSYDYSNHILEQINYINKTRPEIKDSNKEAIDYAFFGITLMSESRILDKEVFLKKYELKFKETANAILESYNRKDLTNYYMLSFIAEQCGYDELKEIVKETFFKLQKKFPKEIAREIEKVEKGENDTVQNENELMGIRAA